MAIKTIREGKIPPKPVYHGTCSYCGWMGECDVEDARVCGNPQDAVRDRFINCPTCMRHVIMCEKKIPTAGDFYGK